MTVSVAASSTVAVEGTVKVGTAVNAGTRGNKFRVIDGTGNGTLQPVEKSFDFEGGGGYYVETYPSWETESEIVRIKMSHNPTITNNRAGDIIATQYS